MIKDLKPTVGVWTDLYALSGIAPGTRLQIQNKSGGKALVWEGAAPPTAVGPDDDNRHGYQIFMDGDPVKTTPAPVGCWVLYWEVGFTQTGRMCVQEYVA